MTVIDDGLLTSNILYISFPFLLLLSPMFQSLFLPLRLPSFSPRFPYFHSYFITLILLPFTLSFIRR